MNSRYWHGQKNISDFTQSQPPLVQTTQLKKLWIRCVWTWLWNLQQQFEIWISKSYRFCPKVTKNVKLWRCKKLVYSACRHQWLWKREREKKSKVCFCIMCDRRLIASLDRGLLCLFCPSMLLSSVKQAMLSSLRPRVSQGRRGKEINGYQNGFGVCEWGLVEVTGTTCHYNFRHSSKWTPCSFFGSVLEQN